MSSNKTPITRSLDPSIRMFMNSDPDPGPLKPRVKRKHDGTVITHIAAPSTNRIRVVCVSDTHGRQGWDANLPAGDILIHAGDLSLYGAPTDLDTCFDQLKALPFAHKLVVAGNHDLGLDRDFIQSHTGPAMRQYAINLREQRRLQARWRSDEARLAGIIMLQNESIEVVVRGRRLNVYGSPLSPFYCDWAFSYAPDEDPWRIREDVDIVITHSPPKGTMDLVPGLVHDGHVGCPHLRDRISQVKPMLHVFGHIHEGAEQGLQRTSLDDGGEILSVNAALLNERYEVAYDATVVDL